MAEQLGVVAVVVVVGVHLVDDACAAHGRAELLYLAHVGVVEEERERVGEAVAPLGRRGVYGAGAGLLSLDFLEGGEALDEGAVHLVGHVVVEG